MKNTRERLRDPAWAGEAICVSNNRLLEYCNSICCFETLLLQDSGCFVPRRDDISFFSFKYYFLLIKYAPDINNTTPVIFTQLILACLKPNKPK